MITGTNEWSVYKLTDPLGKVYIGMTKNVKHRWRGKGNGYKGGTRIYEAIQKYGWDNFEHEIVCDGLTEEEAEKKEIELIEKYKSTDALHGYNLQHGGKKAKANEATIAKLREVNTGHPVSEEVRATLREARSVPVICLETCEIFHSAEEASEITGIARTSIGRCCLGKQSVAGGMHFAKVEDYNNGTIPKYIPKPSKFRKVLCVETKMVYDNVSEASRLTHINRRGISYACNGKYEQFMGYHWRFC